MKEWEQDVRMGTGCVNGYRCEWEQDVRMGTGCWKGYRIWEWVQIMGMATKRGNRCRDLECVQDVYVYGIRESVQDVGIGTGYSNGYRICVWGQDMRIGTESWNGLLE